MEDLYSKVNWMNFFLEIFYLNLIFLQLHEIYLLF